MNYRRNPKNRQDRRPRPIRFDINTFDSFPREDLNHPDNRELRKMWWRLRRRGHRLPAERNVIVIQGIRL